MKRNFISILFVIVIMVSGCEKEKEIACYPQRVTKRFVGGSGATSLTADYKYVGDTLDRIIWSNYQTHFFTYNQPGNLSIVSRKNVQTFKRHESRLVYEDELVLKVNEYIMNLDRSTQEDIDTILSGYREFEYDGGEVQGEKVYSIDELSGEMGLDFFKKYEYDLNGNMISYVSLDDINGDTTEAFSYTYDNQKNPFSSLNLLFEGETHVNNIVESIDLLTDNVYSYQISYSFEDLPEQINIKQESILLELITIDYMCK